MSTINDQRPRQAAAKLGREGKLLELADGRAYYELDAEPGVRKGPAVLPINSGAAPAFGQRCAVLELDTGTPVVIARWFT